MGYQTLDKIIIENLQGVVEAVLIDEPKKFWIELRQNGEMVGRIWWDVTEFDFSIDYIKVEFWFEDKDYKTVAIRSDVDEICEEVKKYFK